MVQSGGSFTISGISNELQGATAPARSFSYDSAGNRIGDGRFTYSYSDRGRLAHVGGATSLDMLYNGLGQRVAKVGMTPTYYAYDEAGHTIGTYQALGVSSMETVYLGDVPVAVITPTTALYLLADHLNAPLALARTAGTIVWDWRGHDPFGNGVPVLGGAAGTGTVGSHGLPGTIYAMDSASVPAYDHRFPGQVADAETGLFYNYFRDYDPQAGRYIESDPIGLRGGLNTYAYVGGDPVSSIDRRGLSRANHKGQPMDPNGQGCLNIKKRIDNLKKEIQRQIDNLAANPRGLPEACPPGGSYKDSVQGHRELLDKYRKDLKNAEEEYDNRCAGGDDGPSATAPSITPEDATKAAALGSAAYWIISEGSRVFFPRNLLPIP